MRIELNQDDLQIAVKEFIDLHLDMNFGVEEIKFLAEDKEIENIGAYVVRTKAIPPTIET